MELDEALVFLGDFGRYQTIIYILICLAGQVPSAWHMLAVSFLGAVPGHHCKVPPSDRLEDTVPKVGGEDGGAGGMHDEEFAQCVLYANKSVDNTTVPCDDGWQYDITIYGNTIVTEWNLVCDSEGSVELTQTIFMTGVMVGSLLFGHLSDRFGRRYVFFLSLWAQVAFGVGAAFTGNLYAFTAVRFFVGVIEQGVDITSYVMVTEMFSPSKRAFAGIMLTLFWAGGIMSLSGIAYLLRDWRHLQLVITLPSLLTIPLWWVIPESTRWLMSRDRVREAEAILHRIARFNKVDLPDSVLTTPTDHADAEPQDVPSKLDEPSSPTHVHLHTLDLETPNLAAADIAEVEVEEWKDRGKLDADAAGQACRDKVRVNRKHAAAGGGGRVYTLWHLFKTPRIRRISLVMIFTWFVNSLVYYGLSLNTGSLAGDPYLNFFLSGAVEIPAYIVSTAVVTWFGRRVPLCVFHVAGGIACIVTAFIPQTTAAGTDLSALIVTTAMLGKFGIAGSYAIVFLYATELFPTVVRNLGVGMSSFSSRVGGILAPIIMYLEKFSGWVPMVIFGGMSIIAGLCVLVLHETLGKRQAQTVDEIEKTQTD